MNSPETRELNLYEQEKFNISNAQNKLPENQISNRFEGLSVLGLVADSSACGYYRIVNPLHLLKLHGANVNYSAFHSFAAFLQHDIIVAPRQTSREVYEALRQSAWDGKLIIYELDDDLDSVLPTSPAYSVYHPGSEELKMLPKIIQAAHGMTTTTPEIARWYYKDNINQAIIPNFIDPYFRNWAMDVVYDAKGYPRVIPKEVPRRPEWEGKIVVMYSGGSTHKEDMQMIGGPMKRLLTKYPNLVFAMNLSLEDTTNLINTFKLPYEQITYVPARHFLDHPECLHGIDIGLAPLIPCQFNLAKSFLKFEEISAVNAVPVGSNVGPYTRYARKHPGTCLLVGNGGDLAYPSWEAAISYLVENPDVLASMKQKARQTVLDHYILDHNIHLWPEAWMQISERVRNGHVGRPSKLEPKTYYKSYRRIGPNEACPCGSKKKKKLCCGEAW